MTVHAHERASRASSCSTSSMSSSTTSRHSPTWQLCSFILATIIYYLDMLLKRRGRFTCKTHNARNGTSSHKFCLCLDMPSIDAGEHLEDINR